MSESTTPSPNGQAPNGQSPNGQSPNGQAPGASAPKAVKATERPTTGRGSVRREVFPATSP